MEKEQRNYKTAGTAFQIGSVPHGSATVRADPEFLFGAADARFVGAGQKVCGKFVGVKSSWLSDSPRIPPSGRSSGNILMR
jgi:hypothetical protein